MKNKRKQKKFKATITTETIEKLQKFELGKPDVSCFHEDSDTDLESKLVKIDERPLKSMNRKDFVIASSNYPEFLLRYKQSGVFEITVEEWN